MTAQKHLKQLIRSRMQKTGERYSTARRHIIGKTERQNADPRTQWHLPGNIPATTALRILLAQQGVRAPHTGQLFSEAMLFGLAGGIGIGIFSFFYEREDIATFFIAGRHQWHDDEAYLKGALERFGLKPGLLESGGAKAAEQQLRATLERQGPCVAWVDMAELPHRAMPASWSGGGYHVVVVYGINDDDTALIGDLTDDPIRIPLADLARARARIKKQKQRLMFVAQADSQRAVALKDLVLAGLRQCQDGLLHPTLPGAKNNARLDALRVWAERLHGSDGKESWERVFRPGHNLWRGLCSIYSFVEHYGTGGGLCRPLFAEFLTEAATALHEPDLETLAAQYAALGRVWSGLAEAALPDGIPAFQEAKELYVRKAELLHDGAPAEEVRAVWLRLDKLERQAHEHFPLSAGDCAALRAQLQTQVRHLYEGEVAAQAAMAKVIEKLAKAM